MKNQSNQNRPTHGVFVVEGEGEKAFWTKIGAAWQHSDGAGLNITLTAVPLSGRIIIRAKGKEKTDSQEAGQ